MQTKITKLIPKPFTYDELHEISIMEGDFEDNYKLALEARNNHYVIEEKL